MTLICTILLPILFAFMLYFSQKKTLCRITALIVSFLSCILAIAAAIEKPQLIIPWLGGAFDFALRTDGFSAFLLFFSGIISFLAALYSFIEQKPPRSFSMLLLIQACSAGMVTADNLAAVMFFYGMLPLILFSAPILKSTPDEKKSAQDMRKKMLLSSLFVFVLFVAGSAIAGYISGTLNMAEIALAKLTLDYSWAIAAFILMIFSSCAILGIFPFINAKMENEIARPSWFRAYILPLTLLLGICIFVRTESFIFRLGSSAKFFMFCLGLFTALLTAIAANIENSIRRIPVLLILTNIGLAFSSFILPETASAGLFYIMLIAIGGFGFILLLGFIEKSIKALTLSDFASYPKLYKKFPISSSLIFVFMLGLAGLPPFGEPLRQLLAGLLEAKQTLFFTLTCLIQVFCISALIKLFFSIFNTGNSEKEPQDKKNTILESPLPMLVFAGLIALIFILTAFGGHLPENTLVLPALEALGFKTDLPLRGTWFIYTVLLVIFMCAYMLHQIALEYANGKNEEIWLFLLKTPVLGTLYKKITTIGFDVFEHSATLGNLIVKPENIDLISKKTTEKLKSNIVEKIFNFFTPFTEGGLSCSIKLALIIAVIVIIIAASGRFN